MLTKQGNTILITGGGSGIGKELAHRWNDNGNKVIVVGRREDALKETVQGRQNMHFYILDVCDSNSVEQASKKILQDHPDLNVLVNNAGCAFEGEDVTKKRDLKDMEKMIDVNFMGVIRVTDAFIDHLQSLTSSQSNKNKNNPVIINVSSGTGFVPYIFATTYSATKAALHSYTLSLRAILKSKGIEVIEIIPPQVATDLTPNTKISSGSMPLKEFADEVMQILENVPETGEIIPNCVQGYRFAERNGKTEEFIAAQTT